MRFPCPRASGSVWCDLHEPNRCTGFITFLILVGRQNGRAESSDHHEHDPGNAFWREAREMDSLDRGDNPRIPAVLKNALDYSYRERNRKGVAFVGYGGVGAARAIDQLRLVCVELQMVPTRTGAHFQGGDFLAVWQKGKD